MLVKPQVQRRFIFGKFGEPGVKEKHFDQPGKLPERVGQKRDLYRTIYKQKKKMKG